MISGRRLLKMNSSPLRSKSIGQRPESNVTHSPASTGTTVTISKKLLKGEKRIIPHKLRPHMLKSIQDIGVEKSKHRARDVMFWSGIGQKFK